MTLDDIVNHKKNTLDKLHRFVICYDGSQPNIISSLADKMEHMIFHIGSPSSISGMLQSIIKGNIKRWADGSKFNGKYDKGAQLRGDYNQIVRECSVSKWKLNKEGGFSDETVIVDLGFVQGHFRWDFTAYTVDRATRDYINNFWFTSTTYEPITSRLRDIQSVTLYKYNGDYFKQKLIVVTKWHRWEYTLNTGNQYESFTTNIGNGEVKLSEQAHLRDIFKGEKKAQRFRIYDI